MEAGESFDVGLAGDGIGGRGSRRSPTKWRSRPGRYEQLLGRAIDTCEALEHRRFAGANYRQAQ